MSDNTQNNADALGQGPSAGADIAYPHSAGSSMSAADFKNALDNHIASLHQLISNSLQTGASPEILNTLRNRLYRGMGASPQDAQSMMDTARVADNMRSVASSLAQDRQRGAGTPQNITNVPGTQNSNMPPVYAPPDSTLPGITPFANTAKINKQ